MRKAPAHISHSIGVFGAASIHLSHILFALFQSHSVDVQMENYINCVTGQGGNYSLTWIVLNPTSLCRSNKAAMQHHTAFIWTHLPLSLCLFSFTLSTGFLSPVALDSPSVVHSAIPPFSAYDLLQGGLTANSDPSLCELPLRGKLAVSIRE